MTKRVAFGLLFVLIAAGAYAAKGPARPNPEPLLTVDVPLEWGPMCGLSMGSGATFGGTGGMPNSMLAFCAQDGTIRLVSMEGKRVWVQITRSVGAGERAPAPAGRED